MADLLPPHLIFTVEDGNNDGFVDATRDAPPSIGEASFWGFVSRFPTLSHETFVEFKISDWALATQATVNFSISSLEATVQVAVYAGSGTPDLTLYRTAGQGWTTLPVPAAPPGGFCCSFSLDATSVYNQLKNLNAAYLGFRFHDPSWSADPSRGQVFVTGASLDLQAPRVLFADIDIRHGSKQNQIKVNSNSVISVAILSTSQFDATQVNRSTVHFGRTGVEASPVLAVLTDADDDGDLDMVVSFKTSETLIRCGTKTAVLNGSTLTGEGFRAEKAIETVGCQN
jgi:hypothetical protein